MNKVRFTTIHSASISGFVGPFAFQIDRNGNIKCDGFMSDHIREEIRAKAERQFQRGDRYNGRKIVEILEHNGGRILRRRTVDNTRNRGQKGDLEMDLRPGDIVQQKNRRGTVFRVDDQINEDGEPDGAKVFVRWIDGGISEIHSYDFYPEYNEKSEPVYEYKIVTPKCYVNVYLHDRAYGGPEEGGWWYDYWEPVDEMCQRFATEEEAENFLDEAEKEAESENGQRRSDIGSVLSEGRYEVRLEAWPAEREPKQRPYYC